jgi:predicted dehydrogenase
MDQKPLNIAIVGCGNIAGAYGKTLQPYSQLKLLGATSRTLKRAEDFVATFGGKVYPSLEAILADDEVDLVINLTIHHAHVDVITQCLNAGKHVYSEKPIALTSEEAWKLVALAEEKGLRFGCAPITMLGEAQQTAWKVIRDGLLGTVRVAYAEVNWGRIEAWHPAPVSFYEVGPLFDVAVYPLTILTTIFGSACSVTAFGKVLYPDRVTKAGVPFRVTTPDFSIAAIEFANGKEPYAGKAGDPRSNVEWSRGVLDMAQAMRENRPQRITAAQAAHVVDIVCGIQTASREGHRVQVTSEFPLPAPMEWAK